MGNVLIAMALIVLFWLAFAGVLRCLLWLSDSFDETVQDVFERLTRR